MLAKPLRYVAPPTWRSDEKKFFPKLFAFYVCTYIHRNIPFGFEAIAATISSSIIGNLHRTLMDL